MHPRWDDPIRRRTEAAIGKQLSDEDWQYLLDERYLEDEVDFRPTDEQPAVLAQEIRRLYRDGELPRSIRARFGNYSQQKVHGWLTDDESTMAVAISDAVHWRALSIPLVRRMRAWAGRELPNITEAEVRDYWVAGKSVIAGHAIHPDFPRFVIELADTYGWDAEDTAVFLLTGLKPPVEPLRAFVEVREFCDEHGADRPRARARITLEFDPWLSKETVANAYEKLRRGLIGKGRKRPEFPELEVFRFVVARLEEDGTPKESWSAIGREWNEKHKEWSETHPGCGWKYTNAEDIKRAYLRVRQRIINPEYHIQGSEPVQSLPALGIARGTTYRMFVDPRERSPAESPKAKRARTIAGSA